MQLFTHDDFEGDDLKSFERANKYRNLNSKLIDKIAAFGKEPDIANARIDFMLVGLVEAGVLSKTQYCKITSDLEVNLNKQLQSLHDKLEVAYARAQQEMRKHRRESLATPPSKSILLPDGRSIPVKDKQDDN